MSRFGYSPDHAERVKDQLDRDLGTLEHYVDRIARAVPQAGATTTRLDDVKDGARDVVSDLHDVITERTEVAA